MKSAIPQKNNGKKYSVENSSYESNITRQQRITTPSINIEDA